MKLILIKWYSITLQDIKTVIYIVLEEYIYNFGQVEKLKMIKFMINRHYKHSNGFISLTLIYFNIYFK